MTWLRRWRKSGEREARKQGARPGSKLDLYEAFLLSLIGGEVDVTLEEMRVLLWAEKGVTSGIGTLWRFFDARGITVKKDGPCGGAVPRRRERGARGVVCGPARS